MDKIPFWEKYTLSIDEAAAYFRIGRDKLVNKILMLILSFGMGQGRRSNEKCLKNTLID